nr:MAG TPA: Nuclease domain [Caudoviricetes sp.]
MKLLIDIFYSIGYTFSCYIKLRNNTYIISPVNRS